MFNDDCSDAVALPSSFADTPFNATCATTDGAPSASFCDYGALGDEQNHNDVWFTYTPDVGGCIDCPCFNNAPITQFVGCLNSSGAGARLFGSGDPSVSVPSGSTSDLRFAVSDVPAFAFYLLNSGAGLATGNMGHPCFGLGAGVQSPVFDGLRCAVANTRVRGGRSADANNDDGALNFPWGAEGGPAAGLAVAGGGFVVRQTRFFQVIHRDDPLAVCMRGLNTSQALRVTVTPWGIELELSSRDFALRLAR